MSSLSNFISQTDALDKPLIAIATGSGQIVKSAVASGVDILIALNAGVYRNKGFGSLAAFMPYANANDQTEELITNHILPHAQNTPIIAGVFPTDPSISIETRLLTLKNFGVQGITNWPAIGFIDGELRRHFEEEGLGIEAEIAMLQKAKEMGFVTFGFALNSEDARAFTISGVDALILNIGLSYEIQDTIERRNQLQLSITKAKEMLASIHATGRKPLTLLFGGSITQPEDFDETIRQVPIHGLAGGSVFERFPINETINLKVKEYKNVSFPHTQAKNVPSFGKLIGRSFPMRLLFDEIKKIAPFDINVCIEGESGTGKELIATQIHLLSPRKNHPFITVNCGAIPDTLVESEFFGYEKGAFTGAQHRRSGKFELAHKGTLFLDEIADLSLHAQAALLRVIQQKEVVTLGGQKPLEVDVRILCASNQNLEKLVAEGKFRLDLYFRLSTFILKIPPLRNRAEDIPLLVTHILGEFSEKFKKTGLRASADFLERLKQYTWPGNVRQLEQVLTRSAIIESTSLLEGKDFTPMDNLQNSKEENLKLQLESALRAAKGNKTKAAQALGISRKTMYEWMKKV